jgi:hypothetical protein
MRKEETVTIDLLHRAVPAKNTDEGLRALSGESPIHPESVQKYLEGKFADALEDVTNAMLQLAKSLPVAQLAERDYGLYEKFRPDIPSGKKGWGPPASWTWTLFARCDRPDPLIRKEDQLNLLVLLFQLTQDLLDHLSVLQTDGQKDGFHRPGMSHVNSGTGVQFGWRRSNQVESE